MGFAAGIARGGRSYPRKYFLEPLAEGLKDHLDRDRADEQCRDAAHDLDVAIDYAGVVFFHEVMRDLDGGHQDDRECQHEEDEGPGFPYRMPR